MTKCQSFATGILFVVYEIATARAGPRNDVWCVIVMDDNDVWRVIVRNEVT